MLGRWSLHQFTEAGMLTTFRCIDMHSVNSMHVFSSSQPSSSSPASSSLSSSPSSSKSTSSSSPTSSLSSSQLQREDQLPRRRIASSLLQLQSPSQNLRPQRPSPPLLQGLVRSHHARKQLPRCCHHRPYGHRPRPSRFRQFQSHILSSS